MKRRNTAKRAQVCAVCGLHHARLGIEIADGVLLRTARESEHLIKRYAGGAWGFDARLFDAHVWEIRAIQIVTTDSGRVFHADADTFTRCAFRAMLNPAYGEQIIMTLRAWKIIDTRSGPGDGVTLADAANETAQALEMQPALPAFGDARMIAALRRAHRR